MPGDSSRPARSLVLCLDLILCTSLRLSSCAATSGFDERFFVRPVFLFPERFSSLVNDSSCFEADEMLASFALLPLVLYQGWTAKAAASASCHHVFFSHGAPRLSSSRLNPPWMNPMMMRTTINLTTGCDAWEDL